MFLPSLTIVSNVLKVLFFATLTREDLPSCLTIVTIDFGLHAAHFATYIGLSRASLPLPVGLFVPPPRPVSNTDLALYITPVAAVTVDALSVLLKPVPRVVTLHYPQLHSANRSLSVGPPPSVDVELFYALLSSHATTAHSLADIPSSESSPNGSRAPLSAAISLGQCTPYRVLPTRGDVVLEMDISLDEPAIEAKVDDYATELLDRLEGSEEVTKEFLFYRAPPCTADSCAMVVYVKRSELVFEPYVPICVVLALWCYVWFVVVAVLSLVYWLVPLVSRILLATLGFVHRLLNAMLIVLVMFAVNVCVRLYINILVGTNRDSRDVKHALPFDIPSPAALPSLDRTPIAIPTPDLESPPMELIELADTAPLEEELASSVDTVEEGPVTLVGPSNEAVDTPAIDPASVPLPEDSEDEGGDEVTPPPSVQAPSLPAVEPSQGLGEEDLEEGEWTTVVKKKPWRPFVPAPNAGASSNSRGGGRKNGRGRGKGKGEGGSKGKGKGKEGGKA
ncbi:hypothetical protein RhiJN_21009 [Ceratobasidium sp. AG-Ba]|nr:hypothetical protein RhiJN_21009 [Ceratobasidium sp. AG-Ba]